jgi:uncharacterized membrane protein YfcA
VTVYLPIAELSISLFYLIGIGAAVGFLSGLFGVGGGFLLTPLLVFSGVPSAIAVASVTSQVVASSTSGALSHYRRKGIDYQLAACLIASSTVGSVIGVAIFNALRRGGQLDLLISLGYVILLSFVGSLMLLESVRSLLRARRGIVIRRLPNQHGWLHRLPLRVRFKRSRLYMSVIPVLVIGLFIGIVGALLGVGGGFILVPALVYLLRIPGNVVVGTSLLQVVAMMAVTTVLHAVQGGSVDILLAFWLMAGGTVGAQFGASAGKNLKGEQLRLLLALLILAIAARFGSVLVLPPDNPYSVVVTAVGQS